MNKLLKTAPDVVAGAAKGITKARAATVAAAGAAGALATWFLDPQNGKRRRNTLRDRTFGILRRGAQSADRQARYAAGQARGAAHKVTPGGRRDSGRLNDPALARKVETEIFRDERAPKGSVDVNAENGVIYLRGEVKRPEQIEELGEAARQVDGVKGVKNLLHLPNTAARSK